MKRNVLNSVRVAALAIPAVLALGIAAVAGPYPGNLMTLTNGPGNTSDLFTISGNGITVTANILSSNKYYLDNKQLVGFRSIYLVKADGTKTSVITTVLDGGYSHESGTLKNSVYTGYNQGSSALGGYTGYDDNGPGKGFSNGSHWVVVADPTLAGKSTTNKDTFGSFTFSSPITSYIGLDYILAGTEGNTGRGYFALPLSITPNPVPEPGSLASLAVGSLGLGFLVLRARKRSAKLA